jgi:hypothetical protein
MPPKNRQKRRFSPAELALKTTNAHEFQPAAVSTKKVKLQTKERNFQSAAVPPSFVVPTALAVCSAPTAVPPSVQVAVLEPQPQPQRHTIAPLTSCTEAGAATIAVATTLADSKVHAGGRAWSQLKQREKGTYACVKAELLFRRGITLDMDEADFNSLGKPATGPMQQKIWCRRGDVRKKDSIASFMSGTNRLLSKEEMDAIHAKKSAALKLQMPRGSTTTLDSETSRAEAAHASTGEDCVYVRTPTWEFRLADEGIATHADLAAHNILFGQPIPYDLKVWSAWQQKTARIGRPGGKWTFNFSAADLVKYLENDIAFDAEGVELVAGTGEVSRVRYLIWGPADLAFLRPIHAANEVAAAAYEIALAAHKTTPEYQAALVVYEAQMVVCDAAKAAHKTAAHAAARDGTAEPEAPRKPTEPALPIRPEAVGSIIVASLHGNPTSAYGKWVLAHRYVMDSAEDAERFRRDRAEAMQTSRKFSMRELNETRAMVPGSSHWKEFQGMAAVRAALATQGIRLRRRHADTASTPDYHLLFDDVDEKVEAKTERPNGSSKSVINMRHPGGLAYGPNDFGQFHIVRGNMARVIPMRYVGADGVVKTTFTARQLGAGTVRLCENLCQRFPAHDLGTPAGRIAFAAACRAAASVPLM